MKTLPSILFLCTLAFPAMAENTVAELQALQGEITASTSRQTELVRGLAQAASEQEQLSAQLVNLARDVVGQELALTAIEDKVETLKRDNAEAELALAARRDDLSNLLAGLQRLEQNPPPALVVAPGDVLKALRGAMMFGAVIPELRQQTEQLKSALAHVHETKAALKAEQEKSETALNALNATRDQMKGLLQAKREAAGEQAVALSTERSRMRQLSEKARSLQELLAAVAKSKAEDEARAVAAEEAAYQAELDAAKALEAARNRPPIVFSAARGRLTTPVQGRIVRGFGSDNGQGSHLEGQMFEARPEAIVISPVDGKVEFAGTFMSYDQVLILNPGEGHLVLLAGMAEITVGPGEMIRAGEPVGKMGQTADPRMLAKSFGWTRQSDLTQPQSPVLYVEFRKKQNSIDPQPWWVAGR